MKSNTVSNIGYLGCITCSLILFFVRLEKYDKNSILNSQEFRSRLPNLPLQDTIIAVWFIFLNISMCNVITSIVYCTQLLIWNLQVQKSGFKAEGVEKAKESYSGLFGLPVLDGKHRIQNVCIYAFFIGMVGGFGIDLVQSSNWQPLGAFIVFVSFFHTSEYCITARFQNDASLSSFLLDHSREYHVAMVIAVIENVLGHFVFSDSCVKHWFFRIGFCMSLGGQLLRTIAMFEAGSNFNHVVQVEKKDEHQLVSDGIYKYLRHPSYTGFFYWSVGLQIMLMNPISLVLYLYALVTFYSYRIPHEEAKLVEFFGSKYKEYRNKTFVFIPIRKVDTKQE